MIRILSTAFSIFLLGSFALWAAPSGTIWQSIAVCDPWLPNNCLKPDSNGALLTTSGSGASADQVQGNIASGVADSGNPVKIGGKYNSTAPAFANGQRGDIQIDAAGNQLISLRPITPVVTVSAANNLVLKGTPGNLFSAYAANHTATAGFLVILNATASPADGAITPLACAALPANGNVSINFNPGPASIYSTGITAVLTSAANCFTKTTGVITGFISGSVL